MKALKILFFLCLVTVLAQAQQYPFDVSEFSAEGEEFWCQHEDRGEFYYIDIIDKKDTMYNAPEIRYRQELYCGIAEYDKKQFDMDYGAIVNKVFSRQRQLLLRGESLRKNSLSLYFRIDDDGNILSLMITVLKECQVSREELAKLYKLTMAELRFKVTSREVCRGVINFKTINIEMF